MLAGTHETFGHNYDYTSGDFSCKLHRPQEYIHKQIIYLF